MLHVQINIEIVNGRKPTNSIKRIKCIVMNVNLNRSMRENRHVMWEKERLHDEQEFWLKFGIVFQEKQVKRLIWKLIQLPQ